MVFGGTSVTLPQVDLVSLAQYHKPLVNNMGVKVDSDVKFDSQIKVVVKSSFFQLRQLANIKPVLQRQQFETVIHAFVTTRLDYCHPLYMGVSGSSIAQSDVRTGYIGIGCVCVVWIQSHSPVQHLQWSVLETPLITHVVTSSVQ